jgi:hypothetical protein
MQYNDTKHNTEHFYAKCPLMLSVIYCILIDFMLNVIMLSVVAPFERVPAQFV